MATFVPASAKTFILDSDLHSVNGDIGHLLYNFDQPIDMKQYGGKARITFYNNKLTNTVKNVSSELKTDGFRYSMDEGKTWLPILFEKSLYNDVNRFTYGINFNFVSNATYATDPITGEYTYPFALLGNQEASKAYFEVNIDYKDYAKIRIDIAHYQDGSASNFYTLLGFRITETLMDASAATSFLATDNINIYDGLYKLYSPQVDTGVIGNQSKIILQDTMRGEANGYYFTPNEYVKIIDAPLISYGDLSSFELSVIDRNGKILKFEDTSIEKNIYFNCMIYKAQ